jgi:beta-glucanase (GH16 family)
MRAPSPSRAAGIGLLAASAGCASPADDSGVDTSWALVWSDEFDGPAGGAPDPAHWTPDVGGDGWGNEQLEFNTDRTENAFTDGDGHLVIRALKEDYGGNAYTSARLTSVDKVEYGPARVEARIRVPQGDGIWPAFWMLGADFPEVGWPGCGEVDILEVRGDEPETVHTTVHGPGYSGGDAVTAGTTLSGGGTYADDFHDYAVDIDPEHIVWWVDGERVHTVRPGDLPAGSPWVFDGAFFLILNVAVGGTFLAPPTDETPFPADLTVDHVRIYERAQ